MADDGDRSTVEIKHLLLKLNPRTGGHKDRIRGLTRFKNYVSVATGGGGVGRSKNSKITTPGFYDDDLPLLFLGSHAASLSTLDYDEDDYGDLSSYYGLLPACGTESKDMNGLKRSARTAMNLVKYLVIDHVDLVDGEPDKSNNNGVDPMTGLPALNTFADALCTLQPEHLKLADFESHLVGENNRGGAKEDACKVLVLLLTRHYDPTKTSEQEYGANPSTPFQETKRPTTLFVEDVLPSPASQKVFGSWLMTHTDRDVQNAIKAVSKRLGNAKSSSKNNNAGNTQEPGMNISSDSVEVDVDILASFEKKKKKKGYDQMTLEEQDQFAEADRHAEEQLEDLGLKLFKIPTTPGSAGLNASAQFNAQGLPTQWKDSELAKSQELERQLQEKGEHKSDEDAGLSKSLERQKLSSRDPLGLRPEEFDMKLIQERAAQILFETIHDLEEEMEELGLPVPEFSLDDIEYDRKKRRRKKMKVYSIDTLISLEAQRNSLHTIISKKKREMAKAEKGEAGGDSKEVDDEEFVSGTTFREMSILPTDKNFHPLLFLTLVHQNASFEDLQESIGRLSNQTDNQHQRLQDLVRDNFGLFIRCSDGIDLFAEGKSKHDGKSVHERLDSLDTLAESCSDQAKKSFKPLLDNTNEVRKVQSALAVLHRIGPLLQVPSLMRQHIENNRFSEAVKAYRRVLVIKDNNKIELLQHVKNKAVEAAQDARRDLECTLANPTVPVQNILDAIRDLGELIELEIPTTDDKDDKSEGSNSKSISFAGVTSPGIGKFVVGKGGVMIDIRAHPPSSACLLLQAAHFAELVKERVIHTDETTSRIYNGETLASLTEGNEDQAEEDSTAPSTTAESTAASKKRERNRWKYDTLEARVLATIETVSLARTWLPRLLRIGEAARQSEKQRAARVVRKSKTASTSGDETTISAFEVFITNISPSVRLLVEHASFCALGCHNTEDEGQELRMTYGASSKSSKKLQSLLRSPLPSVQSSKCASKLAELADLVLQASASAIALRPHENDIDGKAGMDVSRSHSYRSAMESTLDEITRITEEAVITVERRKCIYAFDECSRTCSRSASGSGVFDGDIILECVHQLAGALTRPEHCAAEIEKGCELVVRKCCEGLATYVRDRGDSAKLRAVSECASALVGSVVDVVREVSYLTNGQCATLEESLLDDILALESLMFDEFLESIRTNISTYTKLGPMNSIEDEEDEFIQNKNREPRFPAYLSASLLAIVRCRAQVERTLGDQTIRKSTSTSYQFQSMSTAADSVVDGICSEMVERMPRMRGSQAEIYLSELQFLINTLKKYLSDNIYAVAESCKNKLLQKAAGGFDGPDGLGKIEQLERLGRVYVFCLGD